MAGRRVFTLTARSPVVRGWGAQGSVDVCVLGCTLCMGTYHPGGRAHCRGPGAPQQPEPGCSPLPSTPQSPPRGPSGLGSFLREYLAEQGSVS